MSIAPYPSGRMAEWLAPFSALFTRPTWRRVMVLATGTILATHRRTVSAALRATGHGQASDFARYHAVLNGARWSARAAAWLLLRLTIETFVTKYAARTSMFRTGKTSPGARRRICRERKVLIAERVAHVNRIKGLLFSQGVTDYKPLRWDRRQRFEHLRTGDGRELPAYLTTQLCHELDRLELLLQHIRAVEAERDALITAQAASSKPSPVTMLLDIKGVGAEFAAVLWS